jgi:pilus assembly protein CpaB
MTLLGSLLLWNGVRQYKRDLGFEMVSTDVLVAVRQLPEGRALAARDFQLRKVPKDLLPMGVLLGRDLKGVPGLSTVRPVGRGSMVLWSDLNVDYMPPIPARRISKGYRAISLAVSETSAVSNGVASGDHVDLVMTVNPPGEDRPVTMTLLQNVTVLSVGRFASESTEGSYSNVTLMVLPGEVGVIVHAAAQGKINLSLRNPDDADTKNQIPAVGVAELVETALRSSLQAERDRAVEVIRGGKMSL